MTAPSLFVIYSSADAQFASELTQFLETGCHVRFLDGGLMRSPDELFERVEDAFSADAMVLVLSEAASPICWPREQWERLLMEQARTENVDLAVVLVRECKFPALLRRGNFFDATGDTLCAMRGLKRWLWRRELTPGESFQRTWSKDLEEMYRTLSDRCSNMRTEGSAAERFVAEAEQEFAAILWISCHERTLAQTTGDLAIQLGTSLVGTTEQNCAAVRLQLSQRRCLLILDAPRQEQLDALLVQGGRSSTLITAEPTRMRETPMTLSFARELMAARRFAEAYELYNQLMYAGVEKADCARDLVWICEQWDRLDEAASLNPKLTGLGEQLTLF